MLSDMSQMTKSIEKVKLEVAKEEKVLDKLKASIHQTRLAQMELIERNTPEIEPPLPILPTNENYRVLKNVRNIGQCVMETCFDYSRCSITSNMLVYLYESKHPVARSLRTILSHAGSLVEDPSKACVYIHVSETIHSLTRLLHWQGDGRNHLIVNPSPEPIAAQRTTTGRAIIVQRMFHINTFRKKFDVLAPALGDNSGQPIWRGYPSMVPISRTFLVSFHGELNTAAEEDSNGRPGRAEPMTERILEVLRRMPDSKTDDKISIRLTCDTRSSEQVPPGDFHLCDTVQHRSAVLERSTFTLVITNSNGSMINGVGFHQRLYESLRAGSIPVILGNPVELPFAEYLDWSRFALVLPGPRVTELHYLLRSFPYSDLFTMKRQGRLVYENYFSSPEQVFSAVLGLLRQRIQIPATPIPDVRSSSVFNDSFSPLIMESLPPDVEPEESLGPLEAPFPSLTFRRNFTSVLSESSHNWNSRFHVFHLFPHTPWEPLIPTESKFLGSSMGFRPISGGEGGSGKEFSQALGGNSPQEQFTVVMLTYERENVLISSLSRLYGLPYLNKVVVVWNSPKPPKQDLRWPDIGVPIDVVQGENNSLNNRFLPLSAIQTEAILSVDDDSHLRHDEIIFGFRVWREHRDRLVGFPGRFHAWDSNHTTWNYNSNYSCQLSMVLTGAAFHHKYYSYLYTHTMPQAIRNMVDELMNCEDLAMNFLISHITRQPPVKVTSRWTFRCPGCPVSLSEDDSHFQERHKCINEFARIYGYNPLLYTQYRADSVLFKTRIPPEKQKCFKFI